MIIKKDKKNTVNYSSRKEKTVKNEKPVAGAAALKSKKPVNYSSQDGVCALYRALSKLSVCSRAAAKDIIVSGRVKVNGNIINDFMYGVNLKKDKIKVDGKEVKEKKYQYIAFNKPAGYETGLRASVKSSKNIFDLIPFAKANGLNTAGWLDKESRGLIVLSNDNGFLDKVSVGGPKLAKFYLVKVNIDLKERHLKEFASGVVIADAAGGSIKTAPCAIKRIGENAFEVIIERETNRQVRKMFEYFGVKVVDLFRYKIGKLKIEDENEGAFFNINPEDVIN